MFGDANLIAQATYPVSCLRRGYRSVPLKNGYSEYLELAALLVHMDIRSPKVLLSIYVTWILTLKLTNICFDVKQDDVSEVIQHREQLRSLRQRITEAEQRNDELAVREAREEFQRIESQILESVAERR